MLRFTLSLRYVMLIASLGAAVGALVILWEGGAKLFQALRALGASGDSTGAVISLVMGATDAFLFAMVLIIFAYAIAFGFVIDLSAEDRERLPAWMRIASVDELKHTLVGVILVYLVVDFATDVADGDHHLTWQNLVLPLSIALIAAAMRLLSMAHGRRE
jgi:uncharacterized membrane protein YqhA